MHPLVLCLIIVILCFEGALSAAAKGAPSAHTAQKPAHSESFPPSPQEPQRGAPATAEEYLVAATRAMAQGRWRDAAEAYSGFTSDFTRPETESVIARFQPALALCLIRQQLYSEALVPLQKALKQTPPFPARIQTALLFQAGLCEWHQSHYAQAREYLTQFLSLSTVGHAFQQAHLLVAQSYLMEGNPAMAAERLGQCLSLLDQEHATQAISLEIRALLEAVQPEQALVLAEKHTQALENSLECIAFQNSLLKMGTIFLEHGAFRQAIRCLRRVRSSQELLNFGEAQLAWLNKKEGGPHNLAETNLASAVQQKRERLQKELGAVRKSPTWDSFVRIQLANAYSGIQRYRESALLLSTAIETFPPDPLIEKTGVMLLQNWYALECWSRLETAADLFEQKYPRSSLIQTTHFFKGVAQQKQNRFEEATKTFRSVITENPKSEIGTRARFMLAFNELLAGETATASGLLSDFFKNNARHELAEEAGAWLCVSYAIAKQHEQCLAAASTYKNRYPHGENRALVLFQECRAFLALGDFGAAIDGFRTFLTDFPEHLRAGEARLLLADALIATEKTGEALSTLESVPPSEPSAFDEAWFKTAKLLTAPNRAQQLVSHLERFRQSRPQSTRFGSAVLETAKALQESGRKEEAQDLVWRTINTFVDDPDIPAAEVLLEAVPGIFHKGASEKESTASLSAFHKQAIKTGDLISVIRAQWALSAALRPKNPQEARKLLLESLPNANPEKNSDRILVAIAEACKEESRHTEESALWRGLLKWHPRSVYKDRVLNSWISDAVQIGDREKAISLIHRMERECPDSPLRARAILTKATLQEQAGEAAAFKQTLEGLLSERRVPSEYKPEALLRLGDCEMQTGNPRTALPYYQRIYVMYGRHKQHLAKAYIHSAEAFEQIGDSQAAARTYREFLAADIPDACGEKALAQQKLARLDSIQ